MPETIPFPPMAGLAICTDYTCRWVGPIGEADMVYGLAYCPVCSHSCSIDSPADEPIILHGEPFDPLAITK